MIKNWLEKTIIGLDLCPFARRPFIEGKILIDELQGEESTEALIQFLSSLSNFQGQTQFETAIIVFPHWKISFEDFHDFLNDCEDHLETLGLNDEYQLVAFHPEFRFEGLEFSNRANLVNSSPLPLIHLLKVIDLEILGLSPEDGEAMSFANAKKLESMTDKEISEHFPWR